MCHGQNTSFYTTFGEVIAQVVTEATYSYLHLRSLHVISDEDHDYSVVSLQCRPPVTYAMFTLVWPEFVSQAS